VSIRDSRPRLPPAGRRAILAVITLITVIEGAIWGGIWWRRASRPEPGAAAAPVVNVLLITVDTLRADAVGAYGSARASTPWIDRLSAGGVRFDAAHAHTVVTLPSHANILSGRYPFVHGVRDNAGFRFPQTLDTLATLLKARGYRTGAFVSAFPLEARFGLQRGFDEYDDRLSSAARPAFLEQERAGTETVARARAWMERDQGRPTFCWVHLYEPHFPYAPPEPFASAFRDNPYAGDVAAADAAVGRLIEPLLQAGGAGRTLVVFTADHGESLDEHGEATHGIFAYEATLRVPLVLYAPGTLAPGVRTDPARHIDILPTVLHLLSVPVPPSLDGRDLLAPEPSGPDATRSYFEALSGALNRGWAPVRGVIDHGIKYIDLPIPELYDLRADPHEAHNLAADRSADARTLKAVVEAFPQDSAAEERGARGQKQGQWRPAISEDASTIEQLRSLGYVSGHEVIRTHYTEDDDPKRLIGLDRELQQIVTAYLEGHGAAALERARALTARQPRMAIAWLHLAHLERESGDLKGAVAALERAHTLNPSNTETASLLGGYLTQDNRPQDAVRLLAPFAARPDADVDVLTTLALARARMGAFDDARGLLGRARTEDPSNPMLMVNEGTIEMMAGRRDAARRDFASALAQDPTLARAHSSLAAVAIDDGRPDEALPHWRAAVAIDASEFAPIFAVGVAQARAGRTAEARACLTFFADEAPSTRYGPQIVQARTWLAGHP
jgi:arylsulfatase A-like enzyme/Tfp pilus assembly protein PilF